jgi:hypothetical protein
VTPAEHGSKVASTFASYSEHPHLILCPVEDIIIQVPCGFPQSLKTNTDNNLKRYNVQSGRIAYKDSVLAS